MIEINLLPAEFKAKAKSKKVATVAAIKDAKPLLYIVLVIFAGLLCINIYLTVINLTKGHQLKALKNKWQSLEAQRNLLEKLTKGYLALSTDTLALQQLINQRIDWAQKLNQLSLDLPSGVWFTDLDIDRTEVDLKGSAVSLQKEEMTLINKFINNLKNDSVFFNDFTSLDLGSYQRKVIGGYDIVDFALKGKIKSR